VADRGDEREPHQVAFNRIDRLHEPNVNTELMCDSIWNCSLVVPGERVVGAKKVARAKCGDCSINLMSDGASLVMPTICSFSPSIRNSVTWVSSGSSADCSSTE